MISCRRGFTLLEVIVALSIGAVVLLTARLVVEATTDGSHRLIEARRTADEQAGRDRWLRSLMRRVDGGTPDDTARFYGDSTRVAFTSWCEAPGGWLEECDGMLAVTRADSTVVVVVRTSLDGELVIRRQLSPLSLRYLAPSDTGASWIASWGQSVLPPAAVALFGSDTTILRIGRRG